MYRMRLVKTLLILASISYACGGGGLLNSDTKNSSISNPVAPTGVTTGSSVVTAPTIKANIVHTGTLRFDYKPYPQNPPNSTRYFGTGKNIGLGCATYVQWTVEIYDTSLSTPGLLIDTDWGVYMALAYVDNMPDPVIRPGVSFEFEGVGGGLAVAAERISNGTVSSWSSRLVFTWRDVAC